MSAEPVPMETIIRRELARAKPADQIAKLERVFEIRDEDRFAFSIPDLGIELEIDRIRRERHELFGELMARCLLPGALAVGGSGTLSIADLNLSSARARTERARLLAIRAKTGATIDWDSIIEDFCQRIFWAERIGQPAVDLRELTPVTNDETFGIYGIKLPQHHPSILFGDGGSGKSYVALSILGHLAENGTRVALFDWELAGDDHRHRLERLFPDGMPKVLYARCDKPLVHEVDRLRRIVKDHRIEYCMFDSVAFAADGPPEAAEVAGRYFRAVRQIGGGSLHIAHVAKAENSDKKPFGSTFWHNGARSTWNCQLAESSSGTDTLTVGFFNRKSNLGRVCAPIGIAVQFGEDKTVIRRTDVAASADLAPKLTVHQRMAHMLKSGAFTPEQIAEEIDATAETVSRIQRRFKNQFVVIEGGRIGLLNK